MTMVTVWYDSQCPLCRREIALMQRLDRRGRIAFVDLATATSCPIDRSAMLARLHATEGGRLYAGAAAFAAMWRQIPLLRPLGLAARNRHVLAVLEWSYTRFLRLRPRLQAIARRFEEKRL
ncbi:thiol-disulfide oxidoreductase DCC family protein [Ancylobacter sp.]|uniref:thiol-disulfide oxidoreductase DCC family protein n=1 Tax=Ancylobacter sp. TaxID=1872567 RepID=UPI003D136811